MLGAIIGDMVGSVYEFDPIKTKEFDIFNEQNRMTDDSGLTICVAQTLMENYPINYENKNEVSNFKKSLIEKFVIICKKHPEYSFGLRFSDWAYSVNHEPYHSCGNGSAMRISPVGWIAKSEDEVKKLSKIVSEITHDHYEGIKGAEAIAMAIYLARSGKTKDEIKRRMINYYPEISNFSFDDLVATYGFYETCQKSVPHAIYCFLISNCYEDAIRNCIAIGGDCDTTGAMAGSIAEAFYSANNVSEFEKEFVNKCIDKNTKNIINKFYRFIGIEKEF